ncbi:MAG: hypothetical protein J1F63_01535 [Oscillospiraceae bacterium]|nr:hypothetical protein [Oscillospiraceae bacterium]
MKMYEKPIVLENEELAEGVYAASSGAGSDTVTATMSQIADSGDYKIHVTADHVDVDKDHGGTQVLTITFNKPVEYSYSIGGALKSGDGTNTLKVQFYNDDEGTANLNIGDIVVKADAGLAVTSTYMDCK